MKLINPQPMETLPEKGDVFVLWDDGEVGSFPVETISGIANTFGCKPLNWSYAATTSKDQLLGGCEYNQGSYCTHCSGHEHLCDSATTKGGEDES